MAIRVKFKDGTEVTYPTAKRMETTEIGMLLWADSDQDGEEVVAQLEAADVQEIIQVELGPEFGAAL